MARTKKDAEARLQDALDQLGTNDPRCACGEANPAALTRTADGEIVCYSCLLVRRGRKPVEAHHPAGRHNNPATSPIPANDHRILSGYQRDWPVRTLTNPDSSPLLSAAASIRGLIDWMKVQIDRVLGWVPAFLEWLDEALRQEKGDHWWTSMGGPDHEGAGYGPAWT
jgi:hypothetical protein